MNRIKELRESRGWLQRDVERLLNLGRGNISKYEKEDRALSAELICKLCDVFGCTADYLLCRSDTPTPAPTISAEDAHLIRLFHAVKPEIQDSVMTILEASTPKTKSEVS